MPYAEWAKLQAAGMQAAAAKTAARQLPGEQLAAVRRHNREKHPCGIKGCKRTAYKGALCKGHWDAVPYADKVELMVAAFEASHNVARKYHRRFLRELQARLA
jgi:hypothetical protein